MEVQYAKDWLWFLLSETFTRRGSDLLITALAAPSAKVDGKVLHLSTEALSAQDTLNIAQAIMTEQQMQLFQDTKELNFTLSLPAHRRFRVNAFMQLGQVGMVFRTIPIEPPTIDGLGLPQVLKNVAMLKRGLVILVGATGTGKSSTLAALVDWINEHQQGHIITVEDPIEFLHPHKKCVVTQREVGTDTLDWGQALKNALRQAPDVLVLGELRGRDSAEQAISFAETGHLVMATLHASNTNQAIDRILSFFPEYRRDQLLLDLSLNLRAVVSQRLLPRLGRSGRVPAVEVLINTPLVADLIRKGQIPAIRELMGAGRADGMQTFDQILFDLYETGMISLEEALRNADSINDLRLRIKLRSQRTGITSPFAGTDQLSIL